MTGMALGDNLRKAIESLKKITVMDKAAIKEVVKELQRALIASDVEVSLVLELSRKIEDAATVELPKGLTRREHVIKTTYDLLAGLLGKETKIPEDPKRILLVGLFGSGKCVHPNTIVPLADGSVNTIKNIYNSVNVKENEIKGEGFVKEDPNIEVFSISPIDLKIHKAKATTLWKLKKTDDLIKIRLDNGNNHSITTTQEHPFFVLENGEINQIRANNLKVGQYVALPKKINFRTNCDLLRQKVIENLSGDIKIENEKLAEKVNKKLSERFETKKEACEKLRPNCSYCTFTSELKRNIIRGNIIKQLYDKDMLSEEKLIISFAKSCAKPTSFPLVFSKEFSEFLGYVLGDGYIYTNYVEISNENREVIDRFSFLSEKLFGKSANVTRDYRQNKLMKAQIGSKNLAKLLNIIFDIPIKKKSRTISIPKIIMSSTNEQKMSFLQAYFDCDGYSAKKHRFIEFSTASYKFARDLRLLLLDCDFHGTFSKKIIKEKPYYSISLKSKDAERFAQKVESIIPKKRNRLLGFKKIGIEQGFGKHEMLPIGKSLREVREYYGATIGEIQKQVKSYGQYEKRGLISRNSLGKFLSAVKKTKNLNNKILEYAKSEMSLEELQRKTGQSISWLNACIYRLKELNLINYTDSTICTNKNGLVLLEKHTQFDETKIKALETLAESDITWLKVKSVELDKKTEFVYDLTVDDYHNFVANEIIVHNTTTTAKLAKYYMKRGKTVGVIAGDTYRPAAFEQLQQLSKKSDIHFYGNKKEANASKVVEEGLKEFKSYDLVITDSAGRSALDDDLVKEIKEIHKAFKPDETWLVLSADIGQVAKKQANAFHDAVGVNGVIITKIDGSSKGGGALAACNETKAGVLFLGTGEKINDLEEFNAERYLSRIMGYGDLQALLEKVKELEEDDALSPEDFFEENFNMRIFYQQLKAAGKIGTMDKIAEMVGLKMEMPEEQLRVGEDKLKGFKVMMDSMTAKELEDPELLNNSRIKRVAKGSGKTEADVRELIKQYKQMKNVFKKMKKFSDPKKLEKMQKTGDFGKMFSGMGKKKKKKFKFR